ncbi:MAG: hypothetical protein WBW93_17885 [Steroidobacteraceae bacterium]
MLHVGAGEGPESLMRAEPSLEKIRYRHAVMRKGRTGKPTHLDQMTFISLAQIRESAVTRLLVQPSL